MKHIGFTGTRNYQSLAQGRTLKKFLKKDMILHHGQCIGADFAAHEIAHEKGCNIVIHPPVNKMLTFPIEFRTAKNITFHKPDGYIQRNHSIVDSSEMLVAFPGGFKEEIRSGTWATIRYTRKKNKKVLIIWPDGTKEIYK